jgi:hypothetical protein
MHTGMHAALPPGCWARRLVRLVLICPSILLLCADDARAQSTVVIARIACNDVTTQRFAEVFHQTGDWVFPDVGYVDFGTADYREFFVGVGRTIVNSPKMTVIGEVYYQHPAGSASQGARYLVPWGLVHYRPRPRISGEAVYFPYLPLSGGATLQHVVERAKLEYSWSRFKAGGGYGAYQRRGNEWEHKPFVTFTVTPRAIGDIEVWLQRATGGGVQVQLRYLRAI